MRASQRSGPCHPHSDVDIAVMFEMGEVPMRLLLEISGEERELFPGKEVDLAVVNRADPLFLKKILENCRLIFGKPEDLAQLRLYVFKRYQDYRRFLALERQFVGSRLAALCAEQHSKT
ncbi:MAG: nucleotidyltransferase domain-containing protein [Nitrospiraceae bacterium]